MSDAPGIFRRHFWGGGGRLDVVNIKVGGVTFWSSGWGEEEGEEENQPFYPIPS